MTAPLVLGYPTLLTGSMLTAGSEATGAPVEHLVEDQPGKVWRSTVDHPAATSVDIDFGSPVELGMVALVGCNARPTATWNVHGDDSGPIPPAGPSAALRIVGRSIHTTTTWAPDRDRATSIIVLDSPATYRYWRVELSDLGHPAGYLEAELLVMAPAIELELDTSGAYLGEGFQLEVVDPTVRARYGGGALFEAPRRRYLRSTLPVVARSAEGSRDLLGLMRTGSRMAVSILPDIAGLTPVSMWASLVDAAPLRHRTALHPGDSASIEWSTTLTLEEV